MADVGKALAAIDPDRAERVTQSMTKDYWIAPVGNALAAIDPDRAERVTQSMIDGFWKANVAKALVDAYIVGLEAQAARLAR